MSFYARVWRWLFGPPAAARERADVEDDRRPDVRVVAIEASIDLHFFQPRHIPSVVCEYLREAQRRGFTDVRLIHGRGKGIQRRRVQKILSSHPAVMSYRSDGLGSTIATLAIKEPGSRAVQPKPTRHRS